MLGSGLERKKSFLQLIEREWPREWGRGAPAASQPAGAWLQLWASQGELVSSVHTLHWSSAESLVLSMRHGLAQLPEAQLAALKAAAPRPHERDVHPALLDAACATARHLIDGLPAPHDPLTGAARGRSYVVTRQRRAGWRTMSAGAGVHLPARGSAHESQFGAHDSASVPPRRSVASPRGTALHHTSSARVGSWFALGWTAAFEPALEDGVLAERAGEGESGHGSGARSVFCRRS